jgi:hypothetical protein
MATDYFTEPFVQDDGRLKVLWLDDKAHREEMLIKETRTRLESSKTYTPWFAITGVGGLADLRELKDNPAVAPPSLAYDRLEAPYDVYILDFRLCDAKERCSIESHKYGMHAPAAGLLAGMLTALQWPLHPQAIIPYSGYPEEAGDVWNLCWQFRTDGVHLADFETTKTKQNFDDLLSAKVASAYRIALEEAFHAGKSAIPDGQRERLLAIIDKAGEWVDANTEIKLSTVYGLRTFKLGALFFDLSESLDEGPVVPSSAVRTLLQTAQRSDPLYRRARQLAKLFWALRLSEHSHQAYAAIGQGKVPLLDETFPWIGDATWRPSRTEKNVEATKVIRMAILFLVVFEYRLRLTSAEFGLSDMQLKVLSAFNLISHGRLDIDTLTRYCDGSPDALEALLSLESVSHQAKATAMSERLDLLALRLPLREQDLVQLLDPVPKPRGGHRKPTAYAKSLATGEKIGNGLVKLLDGETVGAPGRTIDLGALLLSDAAGARTMMLDAEWEAVKRVAAEMLKEDEMPTFLSDRGLN